jgi:kynurenine formamidase
MKRTLILTASVVVLLAVAWLFEPIARAQNGRPTGAYGWKGLKMTGPEYDKMFDVIKNWGRWGADDVRGTQNLIVPAKRKQAAALVKTGTAVSIGHDLMGAAADNRGDAFKRVQTPSLSSDTLTFNYHGGNTTHQDAGCHGQFKGKRYNGEPIKAAPDGGCGKTTIWDVRDGIVTRAVLYDIPRLRGVPYLDHGNAETVYAEDLEAWEKKTGTKVGAGDVILLRTGRWARRAALGAWDLAEHRAGYHASVGYWFKSRDIVAFGSDTGAGETMPAPVTGEGSDYRRPMHTIILSALGGYTFEHLDLEALADYAAKTGTYEFMFVAAPLRVPGGTGSPINPVVVY